MKKIFSSDSTACVSIFKCLFSGSLKDSDFALRSLILIGLILFFFFYRMSYRDLIVCFHIEIASFSTDHLLKRLYFLQYVFLSTFAKNHMEVTACTYFWIPYFIGLHICFCARIVLFWLLWLSSVI